jgi:hypothetical protein
MLQASEKKILAKILMVMSGEEIDVASMNYLINMAGPATDIAKRLFQMECDALDLRDPETKNAVTERLKMCVSLIAQLSLISGGVNYQDFVKMTDIETNMKEAG